MNEWKEVTLGDISIENRGSYGIAASAVEYSKDLYTYLRITDINDNGTLNKDGLKSVDDKNSGKYLLKPNDIVFARTGGSTGRSYFYDGSDGELVYAGFLIKFSLDPTKVIPKYIKYYTLSDEYENWVNSFNTGSTRGNINAQTYTNMKLKLPERNQQKLLVDTLSCLDDKIELNNRMNKTLEEMAQAIFKSWFVDFEPFQDGEFVNSELGRIPKGWRVGTLADICEYGNQKVLVSELDVTTYYSTENMLPNKDGAIVASGLPSTVQTTACRKGDVLISNIRPYFKKIFYCNTNVGCSTDVLCFSPKSPEHSLFLYRSLYADKFFDYVVAGSKGTKMPRGDKKQIMRYPIVVPSCEVVRKFNNLICPMVNQMVSFKNENEHLSQIRGSLLPKLMSGEIRVPVEVE